MGRFNRVQLPAGDILREVFARIGERLGTYIAVYVCFMLPFYVADIQKAFEPLGEWGNDIIASVLLVLVDGAVLAAFIHGDAAGAAIKRSLRHFPVLFIVRLLRTLGVYAGFAALVIPGIMLGAWFCLSDVLVMKAGTRDPFKALFGSRSMIRGHTLPVITVFAPLMVVQLGMWIFIASKGGVLEGNPQPWTYPINMLVDQTAIIMNVVSIVLYERLTAKASD